MSFRYRAALLLTGALVSTPVWATAATAAPPTVTFSGHQLLSLGALSCGSAPSVSRITVSPGTTVDFANKLGEGATLWAGDSHKHLNDGEMVPVTFSSGPTSIVMQMLPDCSLDLGTHDQMTVVVTAPGPATDQPATNPPAGGGVTGGPSAGGSKSPTGKPSKTKTPKPARTPTSTPSPSDSADAAAATGAKNNGGGQGTTKGNDDPFAQPAATDTAASVSLGDPVGVADSRRSASGLLTLIATVCVVGVSAAAIRAIIAQRATRAITA